MKSADADQMASGCLFHAAFHIQERRNLRFMKELSMLFGLMVGSTRKYVDPSKAVDILKEAFSSPAGITDSQQVSFPWEGKKQRTG